MTTLFDCIFRQRFLLTLRESESRHAHFDRQLKNAEISNVQVVYGKRYVRKGVFKNPPSRGITATHLRIHRLAERRGTGSVLIFEDDVVFVPNFHERIRPVLEDLITQDWDVFYLFRPQQGTNDIDGERGRILERFPSGLLRISGTKNVHAYAINGRSLPSLVQKLNLKYIAGLHLQKRVIDKSLPSLGLRSFGVDQDLVSQSEDFESATKGLTGG
jgi:hypothetical protein